MDNLVAHTMKVWTIGSEGLRCAAYWVANAQVTHSLPARLPPAVRKFLYKSKIIDLNGINGSPVFLWAKINSTGNLKGTAKPAALNPSQAGQDDAQRTFGA